jgi:uncharacterized protein YyaL (SSP411 family)
MSSEKARNRLAQESSPYLLQHAANPVDWFAWGEDAFARARELNRPVHLSIGYFACHWCHVMAHECFEDPAIARQLNENFINIKVDRQERPDIDDLYQRVVQMMGQQGGWPLTVFLTPDQEPFFAGTYFPPEDRYGRPAFPRVLGGLVMAWQSRQDEVRENCAQFMRGYQTHDAQLFARAGDAAGDASGGAAPEAAPTAGPAAVTEVRRGPAVGGTAASAADNATPVVDATLEAALSFARGTDPDFGGLGKSPKFPNVSAYDLMLRVLRRTGHPQLRIALERTLDRMAAGGIQDHLGGGFSRYSVDERWDVPHFEKMLYDNALLVKLYADAYRHDQRPQWRRVFEDTAAYVQRDLRHPEGGFFASEDADSSGEEGAFYAWSPQEVRAVLGDDEALFACHAFGVFPRGNFTNGRSVLQRNAALDAADLVHLEPLRLRLFEARLQRERPGRDENILAGWNGLMIQGLCAAYQATGDAASLAAARCAADFVVHHLGDGRGGLWRAWRDGAARVPGFLDDYAFLANGLFDLYESQFRAADLERALGLVDQILERFWDDGLYYTPSDGEHLVHRPLSPFDNAWPSGTSESVLALFRAQALSGASRYGTHAQRVLDGLQPAMQRNTFGFAHLLAAQEFQDWGPVSVRLCGADPAAERLIATAHRIYHPGRVLVMDRSSPGEAGAAIVCRGQACQLPVTTPEALRSLLA